MGDGADDAADHRTDCGRAEGDARAASVVLDMMHHRMPRRRGRVMMVPRGRVMMVLRGGRTMMNRRRRVAAMRGRESRSGQSQAGEKRHNDFSSLVHITPSLSVLLFRRSSSPAYNKTGTLTRKT